MSFGSSAASRTATACVPDEVRCCLVLIGYGEVGQIFAQEFHVRGVRDVAVYDIVFDVPTGQERAKPALEADVRTAIRAADAARGADIVISAGAEMRPPRWPGRQPTPCGPARSSSTSILHLRRPSARRRGCRNSGCACRGGRGHGAGCRPRHPRAETCRQITRDRHERPAGRGRAGSASAMKLCNTKGLETSP